MNYSIAQESRIGARTVNQDRAAWLATDAALLMVVADGMGGHLHGEIAAQIAVDILSQQFRDEAKTRLADPARFLAAALQQAHQAIVRYATGCRIPQHAAPRTTCVACVVQDGLAIWAHAGDSRLYLIHGQGSSRVAQTRDHTMVQRLLDGGSLNAAQAAVHPLRNRVFSCLGGDATPHIEVSQAVALQCGDLIALCSDGAWSPLGERLVTELRRAPLTASVPRLLDAAEQAAGPTADNLTLIAMRWNATATLPDQPEAAADGLPAPGSDADIERAIAEIRRSHPYRPNGEASS